MIQSTLHELLWQVEPEEIGRVFREQVAILTRQVLLDVMAEEVTALCGPAYRPVGRDCRRAGKARGSVLVEGRIEPVMRPRVRRRRSDGGETEVVLASYRGARDADEVRNGLLRAMAAGVSTRQACRVFPSAAGASSSAVSRLWVTEGRKNFAAFRERDLSSELWFGLILDGIELASDLAAVVAVGLTCDGRKVVLDFEVGASESREVCNRLLERIVHRGLTFGGTPLAVLDGARALTNSLQHHFPDIVIQRCLVHKERNIRSCLSHRHYGELSRLFNRLRAAEGADAAAEIVEETRRFLASHSRKAVESLDEAGDTLTALHRLAAPSTLNVSLLSTNCIENAIRNCRLRTARVTRIRVVSSAQQGVRRILSGRRPSGRRSGSGIAARRKSVSAYDILLQQVR